MAEMWRVHFIDFDRRCVTRERNPYAHHRGRPKVNSKIFKSREKAKAFVAGLPFTKTPGDRFLMLARVPG